MMGDDNNSKVCPNCSERLEAHAVYCIKCGTKQPEESPEKIMRMEVYHEEVSNTEVVEEKQEKVSLPTTSWGKLVTYKKSKFVAFLLSFFIPGFGIIYAGRTGLGIGIFVLALFIMILMPSLTIMPLFYFIVWCYGIIKSVSMCGENNKLWNEYLKNSTN